MIRLLERRAALRVVVVLLAAVVAAAALAAPTATSGQSGKPAQVGVLSSTLPRTAVFYRAFEQRLAELGYAEGRTVAIHFRTAEGRPERLPGLAEELVRLKVDVLVAGGPEATLSAARQASSEIPIVMVAIDYDPVARGHVSALGRPGGNITGLFIRQIELTRKRVELVKEAIPGARRVAVLWDGFSADQFREAESTARAMGLEVASLEQRRVPYELDRALKAAGSKGADALVILASPVFFAERTRLLRLALAHRLPAMTAQREWVEAGALMSYGANYSEMFRRAADVVDRVLRGARPADLPIEQPTRFELVVNLGTARSLGLELPGSVLVRADEVVK